MKPQTFGVVANTHMCLLDVNTASESIEEKQKNKKKFCKHLTCNNSINMIFIHKGEEISQKNDAERDFHSNRRKCVKIILNVVSLIITTAATTTMRKKKKKNFFQPSRND